MHELAAILTFPTIWAVLQWSVFSAVTWRDAGHPARAGYFFYLLPFTGGVSALFSAYIYTSI